MSRDRDLGRKLRDVEVPGEEEAQERALEVIRAAYAERTPIRPAPRTRRLVVAVAAGALLLAIGLSPAGAKVGEFVEDVVGVGEEDAKPALRSLPAAGELLVKSEQGVWIVREDGSKRLLGDYDEATWSPRGLFVAATDGEQLVALEPSGEVRWAVAAGAEVRDPRWGGVGFDTRIVYRSGRELRVVAGDGSEDRQLAGDAAPVAPAWRPLPEAKVASAPGVHAVAYADGAGAVRLVDAESGSELWRSYRIGGKVKSLAWTSDGTRLVIVSSRQLTALGGNGEFQYSTPVDAVRGALSPTGRRVAVLRHDRGRSQVLPFRTHPGSRPRLPGEPFSVPGRIADVTWSPDGEWLLLPWRDADQWLFVNPERPRRLIAVENISEQFDPGGSGRSEFPRVSGWILPQR